MFSLQEVLWRSEPAPTLLKYDRNGNTLWERRFNAAKNGGDIARSIAVDADDSVYVAGLAGSRSILLIKYASDGQELWAREYKPKKKGVDLVPSMGIDGDGNVYLVGTEKWTGWRYRILVLKYSGAGELVWKSPYAVVSGRDNYLMLAPLSVGEHIIDFTGMFGDPINFTLDITYYLAVAPRAP